MDRFEHGEDLSHSRRRFVCRPRYPSRCGTHSHVRRSEAAGCGMLLRGFFTTRLHAAVSSRLLRHRRRHHFARVAPSRGATSCVRRRGRAWERRRPRSRFKKVSYRPHTRLGGVHARSPASAGRAAPTRFRHSRRAGETARDPPAPCARNAPAHSPATAPARCASRYDARILFHGFFMIRVVRAQAGGDADVVRLGWHCATNQKRPSVDK